VDFDDGEQIGIGQPIKICIQQERRRVAYLLGNKKTIHSRKGEEMANEDVM